MSNEVTSVVDPHVHHWDVRHTPRKTSPVVKLLGWHRRAMLRLAPMLFPRDAVSFFGKPDHLLGDYLPNDYRADSESRNVIGFVHVEAGWEGRAPMAPVAETRWLESLGSPRLKGIVGYADLSLGQEVESVLAAHKAASSKFRGIRMTLSHHPSKRVLNGCLRAGLARDRRWREGYARLAEHGLSFDATVYHQQLAEVSALAADHPEIPVILCHAGTPTGYGGPFEGEGATPLVRRGIASAWREGMGRLAELPNVSVKISGLAMPVVGWGYHECAPSLQQVVNDFRPLVDFVVDAFGAERCMFASNFPIDKVSLPWAMLYDAYAEIVADRSEQERRALFCDTASRVYRLEECREA